MRRTNSQVSALGQAGAGLAVAGGLGGDGGESGIVAELLEAIDGVVAGLVVGEDLREEQSEGDPGGVDAVAPADGCSARQASSTRGRERTSRKGSPGCRLRRSRMAPTWWRASGCGRLGHGDLLGVGTDGFPYQSPCYHPRRSLSSRGARPRRAGPPPIRSINAIPKSCWPMQL